LATSFQITCLRCSSFHIFHLAILVCSLIFA
jgi:hypothetical protein